MDNKLECLSQSFFQARLIFAGEVRSLSTEGYATLEWELLVVHLTEMLSMGRFLSGVNVIILFKAAI